MQTNVRRLTVCAAVAAIYFALTFWLAPISYGPIQVRLSEAMCILPFIAPYTAWGLFVGCLLANICNPAGVLLLDVIFGSLATLLAAWITSRTRSRWLAPMPPVLINGAVVGAVLAYTLSPQTFWASFVLFGSQVALGELIACYAGGLSLLYAVEHTGIQKLLQ